MYENYDGDWLIGALEKRKETRPLAGKLSRLRSLFSIQADLERCFQAVTMIRERELGRLTDEKKSISSDDATIDASLGNFVIIVYARSTDVSSARSSFDPRRYYSSQQRDWHTDIIALRNEAIAHFGSGKHAAGAWAQDRLVVSIDRTAGTIGFGPSWQRMNYRGKVIEELAEIIPIALEGLQIDLTKTHAVIMQAIESNFATFEVAAAKCPTVEFPSHGSFHARNRV
jgi:hypothetical protein